MAGAGGQASAIAQELCKDWTDKQGRKHPGIYDSEHEFSVRWAETYPNAVADVLKFVEPRKYRNALFEAAKVLVPIGGIRFAPPCPKHDTIILEDGTERKLSKKEQASLIQMDLMKEEIIAIEKTRSPGSSNITYQLPPEKRNLMHDDRAYAFMLCCWEIQNLREAEELGDGKELNYGAMLSGPGNRGFGYSNPSDSQWLRPAVMNNNKSKSPFSGNSPFL